MTTPLIDLQTRGANKRKHPSHERAVIFSGNGSAASASSSSGGVFTGMHATATAPSSTLFITNIDPRIPLSEVAALFQHEGGFIAFRNVRRMCFIDFASVRDATNAMRKRQNYHFPSLTHDTTAKKLLIDYDKDEASKRNAAFTKQIDRSLRESENAEVVKIECSTCSHHALEVRLPAPLTFDKLHRRAIDGSVCVNTAEYATDVLLSKGEERCIRRSGGVEKQYRVVCRSCSLPIAYASQPYEEHIKALFLLKGAYRGVRKTIREGRVVQTQSIRTEEIEAEKTATTAAAPEATTTTTATSPSASSADVPITIANPAPSLPAESAPTVTSATDSQPAQSAPSPPRAPAFVPSSSRPPLPPQPNVSAATSVSADPAAAETSV